MIAIKQSKNADTRSCDVSKVTKQELLSSSRQHISDVEKGIVFLVGLQLYAARKHDHDKITEIDHFYSDFKTSFETTGWWDNHRKVNRHHLLQDDGVPKDVNLIDVLELIVDCVMAGMARKGEVYHLEIDPKVLMDAFKNTAKLLEENILVE